MHHLSFRYGSTTITPPTQLSSDGTCISFHDSSIPVKRADAKPGSQSANVKKMAWTAMKV